MKKSLQDVDRELETLRMEILDATLKKNKSGHDLQSVETRWPQLSEKDLLAVGSEKHKNNVAMESERFFKRRFGFTRPREQRVHVITLKNQLDFTDAEIRNLEYGKVIICEKGRSTIVKAEKAPYYMGLMMIALLCYQFLPVFTLFLVAKLPVTTTLFGLTCCLVIWGTPAYFCHQLAIRPIRVLQQRGMKLGDAMVFNGTHFVSQHKSISI